MSFIKKLILFLALGFNAHAFNCATVLRDIALRNILQNPKCTSCLPSLNEALNKGPQYVKVMANWVSTESYPVERLDEIQAKAQANDLKISSDLSSQSTFLKNPSESALLTTIVFSGSKTHMLSFFKSLGDQSSSLVNFEILNSVRDKLSSEFVPVYSHDITERGKVLSAGLVEAQKNILLLDDMASQSFVALIDARTFQTFIENTTYKKTVKSFELTDFVANWENQIKGLAAGNSYAVLQDKDLGLVAYVISLNDLAIIQSQRAAMQNQLDQKLNGPTTSKKIVNISTRLSSTSSGKIITTVPGELLGSRASVLARGGKPFGLSKPAIQVTRWSQPYTVAFYPEFLKKSSEGEIATVYRRNAGLNVNDPIPKNILAFIAQYKAGNLNSGTYLEISLSHFTLTTGFILFEKSYKSEKPIITTQLERVGDADEIVFIPVPKR